MTLQFPKSLHAVVSIALLIAGCSKTEAYLRMADAEAVARFGAPPYVIIPEGIEVGPDTQITQPRPVEYRKVVYVSADPFSDRVLFRFDVDAQGKISNVRVVNTTKDGIVPAAKAALESWQFEPTLVDRNPTEMKNFEMIMEFAVVEDKPGSMAAKGALLVLLLPVILAVGVVTNGSLHFGK